MATKVLLINPLIRASEAPAFFPLGLGYISRVLLDDGHDVDVFDINALRLSKEDVIEELKKRKPDVVGITGFITEYTYIKWLVATVDETYPNVPIVIGGGLACAAPELLFEKTNIDIVVIGEGEVTAKELINTLENKGNLKNVDGIWYRENGTIHKNKHREPIKSLDEIPLPSRELFSVETYIEGMKGRWFFKHPIRATNILTSRGCPYSCSYCDHIIWGHKYRMRSAENIMQEIRLLVNKYNVQGIVFLDDTFVLNKKRIYELCKLLKEEKLGVSWMCNARVDLVDKDLLKEMKLAGCETVAYGIESGSQKILDEMDKRVTVQQAKDAIGWTREAGIEPVAYIMIGMLSESKETVEETIKLCNEIKLKLAGINYATPIPGTPLYQEALKRGKIKISLEELLEKWDIWQDNIIVNLTDMPDKELTKLKEYAERKIYKVKLKDIYNFYRKHGLMELVNKAISRYMPNY